MQQDIKKWREMHDQAPSWRRDPSIDHLIKEAEDSMKHVPQMPEGWKPSPKTLQLAKEEEERMEKEERRKNPPTPLEEWQVRLHNWNNNKPEILLSYRNLCAKRSRSSRKKRKPIPNCQIFMLGQKALILIG